MKPTKTFHKKNIPTCCIGLVQMACAADPEANLKKTIQKTVALAKRGAKIVCLQELFRTPYFCQTEDVKQFALAEPIPGGTTETLVAVAETHRVVIVAPLFEKRGRGVYHNSAVVIDADGKLLGTYRKMHIPDDPCFYEKFYFTPGDLGFRSFKTKYGTIGVLICWDQWFPEAARLTALAGADIIFYPTAIGWHRSDRKEAPAQQSAWETIQRAHAIANGVFVAAVNRVGKEGALQFWGNSFVSDPFGRILEKATDKEASLLVDCDLNLIDSTRQSWPFLRDRRLDAYRALSTHLDSSSDSKTKR